MADIHSADELSYVNNGYALLSAWRVNANFCVCDCDFSVAVTVSVYMPTSHGVHRSLDSHTTLLTSDGLKGTKSAVDDCARKRGRIRSPFETADGRAPVHSSTFCCAAQPPLLKRCDRPSSWLKPRLLMFVIADVKRSCVV